MCKVGNCSCGQHSSVPAGPCEVPRHWDHDIAGSARAAPPPAPFSASSRQSVHLDPSKGQCCRCHQGGGLQSKRSCQWPSGARAGGHHLGSSTGSRDTAGGPSLGTSLSQQPPGAQLATIGPHFDRRGPLVAHTACTLEYCTHTVHHTHQASHRIPQVGLIVLVDIGHARR